MKNNKVLSFILVSVLALTFISAGCYQDSPNKQTSKDGTCDLKYTGTFVFSNDGYIYMNYSKPTNVIGAKWQVKSALVPQKDLVIPTNCLKYNPNKLILRAKSYTSDGGYEGWSVKWECYSGSWDVLSTSSGSQTLSGGDFGSYLGCDDANPITGCFFDDMVSKWYGLLPDATYCDPLNSCEYVQEEGILWDINTNLCEDTCTDFEQKCYDKIIGYQPYTKKECKLVPYTQRICRYSHFHKKCINQINYRNSCNIVTYQKPIIKNICTQTNNCLNWECL